MDAIASLRYYDAIMTNSNSPKPRIYTEKRGGKTVTIISGLHTYGSARLEAICKEIKVKMGTGGAVKNGVIEIQGDKAEQIMPLISNL